MDPQDKSELQTSSPMREGEEEARTPSTTQAELTAEESATRSDRTALRKGRLVEDVILWIAWVAMVAFNGYAEIFRFNGTTTGGIAHEADVWFMPAGWAFAIWGLIYIGLAVWLIRYCIAGPDRKGEGMRVMSLKGFLFVLTCIFNIAWLALWHSKNFTVSLIVILVLTALTWYLYALTRRTDDRMDTPKVLSTLDWAPLSLYAAWLSVASVLNAFYDAEIVSGGISHVLQAFAVVILLGLLLLLAFLMEQKAKDWVFGLVIFWSALAIGIQLLERSTAMGVLVIALAAIGDLLVYFPWDRFKLVHR
ncbi:TspO/MBR family protein [Bifidobacterium xylocopae]|uniref:Tryptophan-rich sensory protein n=1 Tax=Bifidobacterium xylocopae TaxID=2493119 RepID=A0A366KDP6_9BIFI|nr:TspO/MBR family protein [Bifidobacterium xylocopae]RBP99308.1 hypothetical protein CRD59_04615 [Bifidobacterium xylocopae]